MSDIKQIQCGGVLYDILDANTLRLVCDVVEDGATASQTLNKGTIILRNGNMYEVTTTIAEGGTFTVGVNIEETDVATKLTQINNNLSEWGTLTTNVVTPHAGTSLASSNVTKVGPFVRVTVVGSGSVNIENNGIIRVGNLPTEYRPKYVVYVSSIYNGAPDGQVFYPCTVAVTPSGDINLYVGKAGGTAGNSSYSWSTTNGVSFWYHL